MFEIREEKTYLYLDEKSEDFSNLATGILTRGLGKGIKIAYIDSNNTAKKLTNFIENLSLSYSFMRNLNINSVALFTPKNKDIISKTLIPQVEYLNITKDMFFKDLLNYDLIIFDNLTFDNFEKIKIRAQTKLTGL